LTHYEKIAIVSRGYEAWNRGDIESVLELVHPDFAWSDPPEVVGTRGGVGRDDFRLYLRSLTQAWDGFRCEPVEFRVAGDTLVVVVREGGRGKLSGAVVEHRLIHVWRFRDGQAVSLQAHVDAEPLPAERGRLVAVRDPGSQAA
jgi:ketosteroid isomerase-like protein